jgi:hypothetical protein
MLVDEVSGGSYWTGEYLIDEQYCTPENKAHPVSQSWKPYWNMNLAPYHIYFDLQYIHRITNISLHDMHNTKNLEISVGEPGNWKSLFIDPCNKYNSWVQHTTDVSTRYIRLSMTESVFAAVNELVLYGYSEEEKTIKKGDISKNLTTSAINIDDENIQIKLNQNPVINRLNLTIPVKLNRNFNLDLFDMNGNNIFSEMYNNLSRTELLIDISRYNLMNGMYLIKYSNQDGICQTIKFTKNNF